MATLEAALAKGDVGAARLTAHTLKGTGANFGAARMQALANAIEERGRNGSLDGASAILSSSYAPSAPGFATRSKPYAERDRWRLNGPGSLIEIRTTRCKLIAT